ncbi:MAG: NAD(P)H-hydrate dehydratase [Deltaproteobacteria bacterium]|nr:NAD(P)H-hydrate dehydratase [Deltaproteobacteria bacterium]
MRLLDETAIKRYGIPGIVLMENAGRGAAEIILRRYGGNMQKVSIFAGKGNNGGDGFVIARHLSGGAEITVYLIGEESQVKGDAKTNLEIWEKMDGRIYAVKTADDIKKHASQIRHSHLLVDAIFGTGLENAITGIHRKVIEFINSIGKPVAAIDVPTGLDASTGNVLGACVKADITITMTLPKLGLFIYPGAAHAGEVEIVDIGIPKKLIDEAGIKYETIAPDFIKGVLKKRPENSHKGSFGHLLVLAGSVGKTGAAAMTCLGAMRVGTGLVTLGIPKSLNNIMEKKLTEVMTEPLPETKAKTMGSMSFDKIKALSLDKEAIAIGPGLTTNSDIKELVIKLVQKIKIPMVIDADGVNVLRGVLDILKDANAPIVLTPHPGEMAKLLGISARDVQSDRINIASKAATKNNVIVVLKGARTLIAEPSGRVYINMTGNSGMATAGTGDVLTGIIAGFIAQGYSSIDAARLGVYLHGLAGDCVTEKIGKIGMLATDLLKSLPNVLNEYQG